jgi:DNA (cytosine-5)-methyltransferase 1
VKTSASFFTGGALFDIGAKQAGYDPIWGVEWDDKIASIARLNGFNVITADVIKLDLSQFDRPDHFHASPPCPNFSVAKTNGEETEFDIDMARAICRALIHFDPNTFTLENVPAYRNSKSFKLISETLNKMGYWWDAQNLNAADFGVPQTRLRLWVRASRGLLMPYPEPVKWRGWYEAIEDLIPELKETQFAPWQLKRLDAARLKEMDLDGEFMIGQGIYSKEIGSDDPAQTITSNNNQSAIKAFIFAGSGNTNIADAKPGMGLRDEDEPSHTVASDGGGIPKAFVLSGGNSKSTGRPPARASIRGRVVKLNVKCLGRFQTAPDDYKGLTIKINGNGVPCKMAAGVLRTFGE